MTATPTSVFLPWIRLRPRRISRRGATSNPPPIPTRRRAEGFRSFASSEPRWTVAEKRVFLLAVLIDR
jgi:hypothetical protein